MAKDGAGGDEARQRVAQALVADVELGAELGAAERAAGTSEEIEHAAIDLARRFELGGPAMETMARWASSSSPVTS